MTIFSLYIFDRHCECVYYQDWHRTKPPRPGTKVLPAVGPSVSPQAPNSTRQSQHTTLPSQRFSNISSGVVVAQGDESDTYGVGVGGVQVQQGGGGAGLPGKEGGTATARGLPFDEESKLVYGVIFSLRNMVKKVSGRDDEPFVSYRTSSYKLHFFEVPSGFKFVLLSDPSTDSLKFVLRQLYTGAFQDYVVRNPLVVVDSRVSGKGIDSDAFRAAVNTLVTSLSMYE